MKKFVVTMRLDVQQNFEIEADNIDKAWDIAEQMVERREQADLDWGDIVDAEYTEVYDVDEGEL